MLFDEKFLGRDTFNTKKFFVVNFSIQNREISVRDNGELAKSEELAEPHGGSSNIKLEAYRISCS